MFENLLSEIDVNELALADEENAIAAKAVTFARYAMVDVEYALAVLGHSLSKEEYEQAFKAMIVRKAKNEVRKYNA